MGVLDPTKVTRYALQKAASVAGLMLTTECNSAEIPKEDSAGVMDSMMYPPPGFPGPTKTQLRRGLLSHHNIETCLANARGLHGELK